ncbi:MAG TPA: GNAT family N-acetyltransferase [Bacteroidia bacterium]|jgi:ElaA protein|nr:GNAT family N-acetyltransferase [Bacteroidia bacterium]
MPNLNWILTPFFELKPEALYAILQLRNEVFVVEQNCVFQDADGKDQACLHLQGYDTDGKLMAYARIVPAGVSYPEVSIGRVITSPSARGTGAGKELMEQSIATIRKLYGIVPIRIGAQSYLQKFYASFGFETDGEEYLEDNIPHYIMVFKNQ